MDVSRTTAFSEAGFRRTSHPNESVPGLNVDKLLIERYPAALSFRRPIIHIKLILSYLFNQLQT